MPLSPAAKALIGIFEKHLKAFTLAELRIALKAAGQPEFVTISALAECLVRGRVRKVKPWQGENAPLYYELNS